MSRNQNSRFSVNPTNINISRSRFNRNSSVKLSFNIGEVVPFYVDEVLPGDTYQVQTAKLVRMQTLIAPIMDNMYLDTYYFFVPNRLTWKHWKQFNGENTESAWIPDTTYSVPQITAPIPVEDNGNSHPGGWDVGTIADYMGVPTGLKDISVNALPFRAYALIINEWFRDQNNLDPLDIPDGDVTVIGSNDDDYIIDVAKGGKPFVACKYHDYFTSCLPSPQKGPDVEISAIGATGNVYGDGNALVYTDGVDVASLSGHGSNAGTSYELRSGTNYGSVGDAFGGLKSLGIQKLMGVPEKDVLDDLDISSGLIAEISNMQVASVNALRIAFAVQKAYEKDARGGTRYVEMLKAHFGVTSPDARQQRPEYLGGNRIGINVNQVVQSSGEVGGTPQGNTAAYSVTSDSHFDFTKSFTEHGFLIGLMVARYDHTYQQGLERFWSRKDRFDYYLPVFANLGEQPVYNKEIYMQGNNEDDEVFGYQEAWAEYRYKPSRVAGEMRSTYAQSLDVWHLGDNYESLPVLQSSWIQEDKSNVDRALQVTSDVSNQLFGDFYIKCKTTRPMPLYSIPGLIDHH